ncbi:hypothetical protein BGX27_009016 [Mortierella sp. AM989]|nr:hypothetical protein BGX27_009016 [Mortierella sp. AM989]
MYPTSKPKLSPSFIPKQTPAKLSYYDTTKQASAKPSYHNVAKQTSIETLSSNQTAVYYNVTTKTFWPSNPIRSITPSYTTKAFEEPVALTSPQRLLVILDLNGTLFYRAERNNRAITQRPHLKQFLDYLFQNCQVMVWSSSQEHSVERMLSHGFGSYVTKLDRIWNRSHFRLPKVDFDRKTLTLKDLEFVWEAIKKDKSQSIKFDQTNTVLIDDSKDKIMLQRYNGLTLKDFDHAAVQAGNDNELLKVVKYLEKLVMQKNVSAYMRLHPFDLEEKAVAKALNSGKKGTLDDSIDKLARQLGNSTL